jgi:hypothetical protein
MTWDADFSVYSQMKLPGQFPHKGLLASPDMAGFSIVHLDPLPEKVSH